MSGLRHSVLKDFRAIDRQLALIGMWSKYPRCGKPLLYLDSNGKRIVQKMVRGAGFLHLWSQGSDLERALARLASLLPVARQLAALGATRWNHQQERGFDFWIMRDPWENEFCILQSDDPNVIAQRESSGDEPATEQ
jgi:hypothetical protein